MPDERLTKAEWTERLAPALERSMREVSDLMTRAASMQQWIRSAAYEAAMQAGQQASVQAEAEAYGALRDDLRDRFPALGAAVRELTGTRGQLDVKWRPLAPNYTRIFVNFGVDYDVDVFVRLKAASPDEARRALDATADALPRSEPFPGRPNERTALVVLVNGNGSEDESGGNPKAGSRALGARVREYQKQPRTVTVLPENAAPEKDLSMDEAPARIVEHLTPEPGTRVDPASWM